MTKLEKTTITLNSIFNFGASLVSTFVSVYLYIYTNSIPLMCLYIIVRIGLFPLFFILGNKLSKKHHFTVTYTIGLALITLSLVYSLMAGSLFEKNPYYVLIAAAIVGAGEGFYYFSANTCNQIVSSLETRASFFAYNGAFNTIGSLLAPIFVSFLLAISSSEMNAYKTMLIVIIIIFIIVIFIALKMNVKSEDVNADLKKTFILSNDEQWKDHCKAVFYYGLRDSLGLNTIGLLVYNAAGNGGVYSKLQTLFAFLTIGAYIVSKSTLTRDRIEKTFIIGVVLKMVSVLLLLYCPNLFGAIAYGTINAFASALYDNSYNYLSANIIGRYKGEMTARVVTRETFLSIGRCTGMAFVLLCYKLFPNDIYLIVAVTILSFTSILVEKTLIKYKS